MKTKFTLLGFIATVVLGICAIISSCTNDLNDVITYSGQVVYKKTTTPFPNLVVKVTNGENIHCQDFTDESGFFSLKVKVNEIDGSYYLLAGDSTCVPAKVSLGGYGQAEVDLGVIEVEGPSIPVVVTKKVSSVSADGAICGGEVTSTGRLKVTARGVCFGKDAYPEVSGLHTKDGEGAGEFTSTLKDLEHNTIYYARAYATNSMGTAYGEQISFKTTDGKAVVTTDSITSVTATSFIAYGTVVNDCDIPVTARGFCYATYQYPTIDDAHTITGFGLGDFRSSISDLQIGTTYYIRAYATNATETVYGKQIPITTKDGTPTIEIVPVGENITKTTILTGGNVINDDGFAVIERGVCWNTLPYPTIEKNHTTEGAGKGHFSSEITGVDISQNTYYIRAYATNVNGTAYSEQIIVSPELYEYCSLKTMTYGGYAYKMKPLGGMTWQEGYDACENMVYAGYNDWFMPNKGEVQAILQAYNVWNVSVSYSSGAINGMQSIWTSTFYKNYYSSVTKDYKDAYYYYTIYTPTGNADYYSKWGLNTTADPYGTSSATIDNIHGVIAVRKYRTENQ